MLIDVTPCAANAWQLIFRQQQRINPPTRKSRGYGSDCSGW
jgi:hypothetical protein